MSLQIHTYDFLVAFADTDCGGVVYYARYLDHAERARTQWFFDIGLSQNHLKDHHSLGFVVKSCQCEYRASGKLEDKITIHTTVSPGKTRLNFEHRFVHNERGLLFENAVTMVCVNTDTFKPVKIPGFIRSQLG